MATATKMTKDGYELLSAAIAGGRLTFTKAVIGNSFRNGAIVTPTAQEIFALTDVISSQLTLPIASVTNNGTGTATVTFHLTNETLTTGLAMREIGIFAKIDSGEEKLYCYWHCGESSDFVPVPEEMLVDMYISVVTVIAEATNITLVIDSGVDKVTRSEFAEHVNDTSIHANLLNLSKEEFANAIW